MKKISKLTGAVVMAGALYSGFVVVADNASALPDLSTSWDGSLGTTFGFGGNATFANVKNRYSCSNAEYTRGFGTGASQNVGASEATTINTTVRYGGFAYNAAYGVCGNKLHTANIAGTVVTAQAALRTVTVQTSGLIAQRLANLNTGAPKFAKNSNGFSASSGVAAGDFAGKLGVWASGTWSAVQDSNVSTQFDGNTYTVLVGADYQVDDRIVVGLSAGYDNLDLDTGYNANLSTGQDGNLEADGYIVAPYASYKLDDIFSLQVSGGYSWVDYDTVRFDPANDERITGSTDANRYFVEVGGTAAKAIDDWRLSGNLSYLYAREEKDAYTENSSANSALGANNRVAATDSNLSQIRIGSELGYNFGMFEPFARVGLEFDAAKDRVVVAAGQVQAADDDFGAVLGGGVRVFAAPNITGSIEGATLEGKDKYTEYTVGGNLRVEF